MRVAAPAMALLLQIACAWSTYTTAHGPADLGSDLEHALITLSRPICLSAIDGEGTRLEETFQLLESDHGGRYRTYLAAGPHTLSFDYISDMLACAGRRQRRDTSNRPVVISSGELGLNAEAGHAYAIRSCVNVRPSGLVPIIWIHDETTGVAYSASGEPLSAEPRCGTGGP